MTMGSPPAMTRSPGSWCGDALLGPEATIENSAPLVALRDEALPDLAGDVRLGPPDERPVRRPRPRPGRRPGRPPAAGPPRRRPCACGAPAGRSTSRRSRAPGRTRWRPRTNAARSPSDTATAPIDSRPPSRWPPPGGDGDQHHRVLGLLPGRDLQRARGCRGAGAGGRRLEPWGDQRERRAVGGRHHQQREALQRLGGVAGQVPEVRSHADQQRVETGRCRLRGARPRAAPRTALRGSPVVIAPPPGPARRPAIQAPSSRSPCSNRVR